jgi:hypothetical protein
MFAHKLNLRGSEFIREGGRYIRSLCLSRNTAFPNKFSPTGTHSPQASHHSFSR